MTTARLQQVVFSPNDDIGDANPGAKLDFFETGASTVRKDTFSDFIGTANINPIFADAFGRFPEIILDDSAGAYRVVFSLKNADATFTQKWSRDNVDFAADDPSLLANGSAGAPSYSFANDPDSGSYLIADGRIGVSIAGNDILEIDANGLDIVTSGEVGAPSLILESDTDTGWRQGAANNWVYSSTGEDVVTLALGAVTLSGPAAAGMILTLTAKTGQESVSRLSGADIAHGLTVLAPTNVYFEESPVSGTAGGVRQLGISDTDAVAHIIEGVIGSTNPTDTIPAVQIRAGKSNGGTDAQDLAAAETAFEVANHDGATSLLSVLGDGRLQPLADVVMVSGKGMDFSLTSDGSGTAVSEVLDDYEEGTWAPDLQDQSSNSATMSGGTLGRYTKIGNMVFIEATITTTSVAALVAGEAVTIFGLPYPPSQSAGVGATFSIGTASGLAITAGVALTCVTIGLGVDIIRIQQWTATTGTTDVLVSNWTDDGSMFMSGSYTTGV